jgi:hypothetical protein
MSMGAYDAAEHQRREEKTSSVDATSDDERTDYEGTVEYDVADADTEDLLAQFREIKSE